MKTCASCGGSFDESLPKCPYCGTLNEEGAEQDYKKKLYKIRKELDQVDELAVDNYKNEVRLFFKVFLITAAIIGFLALIIWQASDNSLPAAYSSRRSDMDKAIAASKEAHEELIKLRDLYDEGKYEELCENYYKSSYKGKFYDWEHYGFISCYSKLKGSKEELAKIDEKTYASGYSGILYDYGYVLNEVGSAGINHLSGSDVKILHSMLDEVKEGIIEKMGMSDEELSALVKKATRDGYVSSTPFYDYANERWGKQ